MNFCRKKFSLKISLYTTKQNDMCFPIVTFTLNIVTSFMLQRCLLFIVALHGLYPGQILPISAEIRVDSRRTLKIPWTSRENLLYFTQDSISVPVPFTITTTISHLQKWIFAKTNKFVTFQLIFGTSRLTGAVAETDKRINVTFSGFSRFSWSASLFHYRGLIKLYVLERIIRKSCRFIWKTSVFRFYCVSCLFKYMKRTYCCLCDVFNKVFVWEIKNH